ncbi:DUF3284 domain-containing protein [Enterococcus sp. LJL90]
MEVKRKLKIPASFFYEKIVDSVVYDVHSATGKTMNAKQLNGFEYVKDFSASKRAKIKIEELEENHIYQFKTTTTRNEFVVRYEINPIDQENCEVTFTESMKSFGLIQQLNDMATGLILGFFKKRRFKEMLTMIEQSY